MYIPFLLPLLHLLITAEQLPPGHINPILHKQALSHLAFHSDPLKLSLANLFTPPKTAAIVGVEWGEDLALFAHHGFHVTAFEPAKKFLAHLENLRRENPAWNLTLVPHAAANQTGSLLRLQYDNERVSEDVRTVLVDDFVAHELSIFSLDVQGAELAVLQGSRSLLAKGLVKSLWVEAIACNEDVYGVLDILEEDYVLFDFVPWGKRKGEADNIIPRSLPSFAFDPHRPSLFKEYLGWMCGEKERAYHWLQTDFLAVKRELVDSQLLDTLKGLAETVCNGTEAADCLLRLLLHFDSEKDEL